MKVDYLKHSLKIFCKTIKNRFKCRFIKECYKFDNKKNYAFIFFAADYNNLGDVAITISQRRFLEECLPNYEVIEIVISDTYRAVKAIKKLSVENVIITLIGGGNNGTLYEFVEEPRRCVLNELRKYRIISFPQTVYFENTDKGKAYLKAFKYACNKCRDLTLIAREKYSYDMYRGITNTSVLLMPDIVFFLDGKIPSRGHNDSFVALILRNDKEKEVASERVRYITEKVVGVKFFLKYMDTCDIDIKKGREIVFKEYIESLGNSNCAITDRLHGMILCYITNTPCYVFGVSNHKIESTFDTWLTNQSFIHFIRKEDRINSDNWRMNEIDKESFQKESMKKFFLILKKEIVRGI